MCDGVGNMKSLRSLMGDIQQFVAAPAEASPSELGERLIELRHGIDLLELRFAREAATFASTDEYEVQGSTSPINWVRHHCAMSIGAAARSVATGEAADRLPASVAALEAGRIGFAHLSLIAGTVMVARSQHHHSECAPRSGRDGEGPVHNVHAGDGAPQVKRCSHRPSLSLRTA